MTVSAHFRLLFLAFQVSALCISCERQQEGAAPIRPVRFQEVELAEGAYDRSFAGLTHAALETKVSFQVAGKVKRVLVKLGDQVESGQLIAELDDKDYRLQVQQVEAQEKSLRAQARNAEANHSRVRDLYASNNASLTELDASRTQMESVMAQVTAIQNQLELVRSQLGYTRLKAPMAGTIAMVAAEAGEVVGAGQPIALLASGGRLEVKVSLPEGMIFHIQENDTVSVAFDAFSEERVTGVVTEVGIMSTGLATTYPVTVRLVRENPEWRPGMAVEVTFRIVAGGERDRLVVPSFAVGEDDQGRFVFVLEKAGSELGIARRRPVQVGGLRDEGIEILSGLKEKELVVTAGVSRIRDGQQVRLLEVQ